MLALGEQRQDHFNGRAGVRSRFQHNRHARQQVIGDLLAHIHDERNIRVAGFVERCGNADRNRIALLKNRKIGCCGKPMTADEILHGTLADIINIGLPAVDGVHLAWVQVYACDTVSRFREHDGQR